MRLPVLSGFVLLCVVMFASNGQGTSLNLIHGEREKQNLNAQIEHYGVECTEVTDIESLEVGTEPSKNDQKEE